MRQVEQLRRAHAKAERVRARSASRAAQRDSPLCARDGGRLLVRRGREHRNGVQRPRARNVRLAPAVGPRCAAQQRDFYFGKLCDIEMYADATAAENDALDVVEQVVAILRLGQDEPRPGSSGRRDVPRIAPTHASQSRVSDGSHSQAESAVSSASVVPILPLDDKWHHALESARLREKVATARQSVQEEEARRAASRAFAPGSRARRCTTRLFEAWEVLARVIPCAPASDAPWRERLAATWPRAAAVRPPTAGADSARQAAAPAAGSLVRPRSTVRMGASPSGVGGAPRAQPPPHSPTARSARAHRSASPAAGADSARSARGRAAVQW